MSIDLNKMPKLGFGLMRLPENDGVIDHEHVCRMVDKYMQAGLNYFDTAYVYHGGKSEVTAREAVVKGGGEEFDPRYAELMVKIIDEDYKENAGEEEDDQQEAKAGANGISH